MFISRFTDVCLAESRMTSGVFDSLRMEAPVVPVDPLWAAAACSVAMLTYLLREWSRQRSERLSLIGGPSRNRPDYSSATLRYLRHLEVDATTVVTALIGLASKLSLIHI